MPRRTAQRLAAAGVVVALAACAAVAGAAGTATVTPLAADWLVGTWEVGALGTGQGTVTVTRSANNGSLEGAVSAPIRGVFCRDLPIGERIWSGIVYDPGKHLYTGTATIPRSSLNCQVGSVQATWTVSGGGVYDSGSRKAKLSMAWTNPATGNGPPAEGNAIVNNYERAFTPEQLAAPWLKGRWTGTLTSGGTTVGRIEFGIGDVAGARDIAWLRASVPLACASYSKAGALGAYRPAGTVAVAIGRSSGFRGGTISIHAAEGDRTFGLFDASGKGIARASALRSNAGGAAGTSRIAATATFWGWLNGASTGDFTGLSDLGHAFDWEEALAPGQKPAAGVTLCRTVKTLGWTVAWDRSGTTYAPVR